MKQEAYQEKKNLDEILLGLTGIADTVTEITRGLEKHLFSEKSSDEQIKIYLPVMIKWRQGNKDNYHKVTPKKECYGKERPEADMDQKGAKKWKRHWAENPDSVSKWVVTKKMKENTQKIHALSSVREVLSVLLPSFQLIASIHEH